MKIRNILFGLLAGVMASATVDIARAQISYDGVITSYSQNFDSLGNGSGAWTDNSTLQGWYLARSGTAVINQYALLNYTPGNQGTGGNTNVYNVGLTGATDDRALAWLTYNNTTTGNEYIGLQLQNVSGLDFIGTVTFSFAYEQWQGTNSDPLYLDYQTTMVGGNELLDGAWAELSSLDSPHTDFTGASVDRLSLDGNDPANRVLDSQTVTFTSDSPWLAGQYLWFRTRDEVVSGKNDMNAIDDVSLMFSPAPVPEPSVWAILGLGMFGLVIALRRREKKDNKDVAAEINQSQQCRNL